MLDRDSSALMRRAWGCALVLLLALPACRAAAPLADRDALKHIVQDQCVIHWQRQRNAWPCTRIYLPQAPHEREGWAVLADRKGGAHFLLIPTKTIAGLESEELLEPGTPNYFAAAWAARDLLADAMGRRVARGGVGLALNPRHARTQDQLHIHIECLRPDVALRLREAAPRIARSWRLIDIERRPFLARRVMGETLGGANPIALLAHEIPAAMPDLGDYTLVVAGMNFTAGPGFILLANQGSAGELLLDSTCAVAALK